MECNGKLMNKHSQFVNDKVSRGNEQVDGMNKNEWNGIGINRKWSE